MSCSAGWHCCICACTFSWKGEVSGCCEVLYSGFACWFCKWSLPQRECVIWLSLWKCWLLLWHQSCSRLKSRLLLFTGLWVISCPEWMLYNCAKDFWLCMIFYLQAAFFIWISWLYCPLLYTGFLVKLLLIPKLFLKLSVWNLAKVGYGAFFVQLISGCLNVLLVSMEIEWILNGTGIEEMEELERSSKPMSEYFH